MALFFIFIAVVGSAFFVYYSFKESINDTNKDSKISELKEKNINMNLQIDQLRTECRKLKEASAQYTQENYSAIENEVDLLKSENVTLKNKLLEKENEIVKMQRIISENTKKQPDIKKQPDTTKTVNNEGLRIISTPLGDITQEDLSENKSISSKNNLPTENIINLVDDEDE
ncbi:MAG: hypothetical protein PHP69_00835 [Candidatus Omnitrophica bacterium]|jgi:regulatory protein YycI of two-component signal transduction system YycFG|nr:hypothetical protein [Candidatus Omnitrophota bacterium]MDD5080953.1 hypothetical protein [Candidatus Omnitrophota bacterium]MDD5440596.1 hypothetical protein [Candidatus Omnitrophota bacterium]